MQVGRPHLIVQVGEANLIVQMGGAHLIVQVGGANLIVQVGGANLIVQVGGAHLMVGAPQVGGQATVEARPPCQLPEGEALQDLAVTAAPHPHNPVRQEAVDPCSPGHTNHIK